MLVDRIIRRRFGLARPGEGVASLDYLTVRKQWHGLTTVLLLAALPMAALSQEPITAAGEITFEEINDLFGAGAKLTDLQKKEYWKKYDGQCVEWTGVLVHLDEGWLGGINIGMRHLRSTFTYDVLIEAPDSEREHFMTWAIDNRYTYRATLDRYGGAIMPITADWGCEGG